MLKLLLKHTILDKAIDTFFSGLTVTFASHKNKIYVKGEHINNSHIGMRVVGTDYPNVDHTICLLFLNPIIEAGPPLPFIPLRRHRHINVRSDICMNSGNNPIAEYTIIYYDYIYTLVESNTTE